MADIVTTEQLQNASLDVQTIEKFVNGSETQVNKPRLIPTVDIGSIAELRKKVQDKVDLQIATLPIGHKGYATLALAQAAQSTLAANTLVEVTNDSDSTKNGVYLWNGTTLAKSAFDPSALQRSFVRTAIDVYDASANSNNYNMTFADAIASVPTDLRKQGLVVRYNNADERQFVNGNLANWTSERYWIRPINPKAEGKVNYFDERMIYQGFVFRGANDPLNFCAIIPIFRTYGADGVENKLNMSAHPISLKNQAWGFLKADGSIMDSVSGATRTSLVDFVIPTDAAYVYINLETNNTTSIYGAGNVDIAKKYFKYFPDNNASSTVFKPNASDGARTVNYGIPAAIQKSYDRDGTSYITPYFKSGLASSGGTHIAQIIKFVEVQKGQESLVNKTNGLYRRIVITGIVKTADGKSAGVYISAESATGVMQTHLPAYGAINAYGYATVEWSRISNEDPLRVHMIVDTNLIANGQTIWISEASGEIHPSLLEKADRVTNKNKGVQLTHFTDVGVAKASSNMSQANAQPVALTRSMTNGFMSNTVKGDVTIDHQQTALVATKFARFYGKASIYADVKANYPNNPKITMLRETSQLSFNAGTASGYGVLGATMDSQWIHPDMCYAPEGVGGYKYWMVNSNYPNGNDRAEDADLFVSNDGVNWTRLRGYYESDSGGLPFKLPPVYWNTGYKNVFMPIPNRNNNSFEFAGEATTETKTIKAYLAHDPAISYHDGYVNVYVIYNFGFTADINFMTDKYVVCYRTNNGIDWEIVREDGTAMPYNDTNAMLIFTKTNGVRNHIRYMYKSAGGVGGSDLSPQVVKVSDNEWYFYTRVGTSNMNLVRYSGTSPYTFNWSSSQVVSKNNATGGGLWHFGLRYYNGVFYCLTNGYMFTSTDGVNFTTTSYPFYWRGMSSDIYKPTFVIGHDGKVKMAYGIQALLSVPHPYIPQQPSDMLNINRMQANVKITATLLCEYASMADIINRSNTATADAYVDVIVMCISQLTKSTQIRLLPCLRDFAELAATLDVAHDDEVYVIAHLNTRNGGTVNFSGVAVTLVNGARY
ncbi:hypothetical protein BKE17_02840 [Enhydrobacter sp. H5]|nr:hypothetical protein BKE17_02840 [Enhydrobacter sp. H5]